MMDLGETATFLEVGATATPENNMMIISSEGKAAPTGQLNYMVPVGSTVAYPTIAFGDRVAVQNYSGSNATTYEGLWGRHKHPRYPAHVGQDSNGTHQYTYHAKSSPDNRQAAGTAVAILAIHDNHHPGQQYVIIGDMNLSPDNLTNVLNAIRPGIVGTQIFIGNVGATHRRGGEYDYAVTNINPSQNQSIGHSNLRGGSDHKGSGFRY